MYTQQEIQRTYEDIHNHLTTGQIIRKYSANKRDIREAALDGLDTSGCERVLDLGCGYGFFIEKLKGRLAEGANITGIDLIEKNNKKEFIRKVREIGCRGKFIKGHVEIIRHMQESSYDLIIASYSLYFFPELIREIARILSHQGVFISLTHTKNTLQEVILHIPEIIRTAGVPPPEQPAITRLFNAFCLEDGEKKLRPYFERVEMITYENRLHFPSENIQDCIDYLDKKKYLLFKEIINGTSNTHDHIIDRFYGKITEEARRRGTMILTKDDAVFRAFRPRHREPLI